MILSPVLLFCNVEFHEELLITSHYCGGSGPYGRFSKVFKREGLTPSQARGPRGPSFLTEGGGGSPLALPPTGWPVAVIRDQTIELA